MLPGWLCDTLPASRTTIYAHVLIRLASPPLFASFLLPIPMLGLHTGSGLLSSFVSFPMFLRFARRHDHWSVLYHYPHIHPLHVVTACLLRINAAPSSHYLRNPITPLSSLCCFHHHSIPHRKRVFTQYYRLSPFYYRRSLPLALSCFSKYQYMHHPPISIP